MTGLSASGKTSNGTELVRLWKAETPNVVFMDGDEVCRVLEWKDGIDDYTRDVRHRIAWRYSDMSAWLDSQDINVVCCGICFFDDVRKRNREFFSGYFEAYIDLAMEILRKRDKKNLYARAFKGEIKNVAGVDLMLSPPTAPDMVIDNSEDGADFSAIAAEVLARATG